MKVAVPSKWETLKSQFFDKFGLAPCYLIFDTQEKRKVTVIFYSPCEVEKVKGRERIEHLAKEGVNAVLVDHVATAGFNYMKSLGITPYEVKGVQTVGEALEKFMNGELKEAEPHDCGTSECISVWGEK
ncbi:NifB/NifX family molybdenum-iron cluster-binding protein [Desulfurobacterium atlanticum]|uniref:Predicted Fe-Mo cluster-binding protein, NifX family n=1 Tax=Desulfurobacterium atlanticum TaxID=240169 RepID=A0A238YR03_9BACT|nr:NifB/NifX family molybdenum-iron cluster-binding protein [Desulfurobacterium atlanticum]SNR73033.1 Predicted Fe-Mo cluster-binding protein, NifX family [Desulfurobacterium atlanticum]